MTIAAGFVVENGILLASDSLISGLVTKNYRGKVLHETFRAGAVGFAIAGDETYAKMAVAEAIESLQELPFTEPQRTLREIVRAAIANAMAAYSETKLDPYNRPQFLISIKTDADLSLHYARDTAIMPIDSHYFIGAGQSAGDQLARTLIRGHQALGLDRACALAVVILSHCKNYVEGCGGGTQMLFMHRNGSFNLGPHEFELGDLPIREMEKFCNELLLAACESAFTGEDAFEDSLTKFCTAARTAHGAIAQSLNHLVNLSRGAGAMAQRPSRPSLSEVD